MENDHNHNHTHGANKQPFVGHFGCADNNDEILFFPPPLSEFGGGDYHQGPCQGNRRVLRQVVFRLCDAGCALAAGGRDRAGGRQSHKS